VRLTIQTLVDPQSIRMLRKVGWMIALEGGFGRAQAADVEVAVSEALSNAFFHAYRGGPGPVGVEFVLENRALRVDVRDEGPPLADPPVLPAPHAAEDARGLYLMTHLMDGVELVHPLRDGRGTLVRLVKRLEAPLPGPAGDLHTIALTV
jgi:anti-sigma regulatory factor (Ser/Thr protein kinase)